MVLVGVSPKTIINPQVWSQREPQPITHIIHFLKKLSHKPTQQKISLSLSNFGF